MSDGNGNVRALAQRDFLFKWGRRTACLILLALVGFGGLRGYAQWRKQHLAKQVEAFVARGDLRNGVLVARRLLALDENNLVACRAMAEMAEKAGNIEAITWRRKVAHLSPELPAAQLAFARTALRFGQSSLAETILEALPEQARQGVEYHEIAAAEALLRRDAAGAESHFAAALQIAPQDPQLALNFAIVRLASADPTRAEEARQSLVRLTSEPRVRRESLRALTADALAHNERARALQWATQLKAEKDTNFSDLLLCFEAAERTDSGAPALGDLFTKAAAAPNTAAELITWLNRHELARVALHWSSTLPTKIVETHPVPLAVAESYSFVQDWPGLREYVEGKNWGELEAVRLAVQSHALHRMSPPERPSTEAQTLWHSAVKTAQSHPDQQIAIAQLAEGWGYRPEAAEAWWSMANTNDNAKVALAALQRLYKQEQDTRGLLRVAKRALELNPSDLVAANNCASLGLLLDSDSTSRRLALKLHNEHPANRAFAATYAYALHTEGKIAEGLEVMESLKEDALRNPAIAAYYVVMLVESGNFDRARAYLADAERASLLPEERQLLNSAARKLNAS